MLDGINPEDRSSVTLAVATFRRPEQLRTLLPLLVAQAKSIEPSASVVVVDNDPVGAARGDVAPWLSSGVSYVHEPSPGISAARNRALDEATASGAIVFIDDDEIPTAGWLARLVDCWREWGCAGVTGPTVAQFDYAVDPWLLASGVFDRRVHETGQVVQGAACNNLLLDMVELQRLCLRFDSRFGLSGGEDTMLIHSLIERGGSVRWCNDAEVLDPIPADRCTRRWVLKRILRSSNSWSRVQCELASFRPGATVVLFGRAAYHALIGVVTATYGLAARDVRRQSHGICEIVLAIGIVLGAVGITHHEYQRKTF